MTKDDFCAALLDLVRENSDIKGRSDGVSPLFNGVTKIENVSNFNDIIRIFFDDGSICKIEVIGGKREKVFVTNIQSDLLNGETDGNRVQLHTLCCDERVESSGEITHFDRRIYSVHEYESIKANGFYYVNKWNR